MHPWSKYSKDEYEKRKYALMGTMGLVGVIMIALFYVQVRVIFNTPVEKVDYDPLDLGAEFFHVVSTEFNQAGGEATETFKQIGDILEDESKRVQAEQAIYAKLGDRLQIQPEEAAASEGEPEGDAVLESDSEPIDSIEIIAEESSSPFPTSHDVTQDSSEGEAQISD